MNAPVRQEVWLISLDPTIGREQAGTRPALVMSADMFNRGSAELIWVMPVTSRAENIRSHVLIEPPEGGLGKSSFVYV